MGAGPGPGYALLLVIVLTCASSTSALAAWSADPTVNNRISTTTGEHHNPRILGDGAGGSIIVWDRWRESSGSSTDIYAQRLDANGVAQWPAGGVALCTATGSQHAPQIVSDGSGGAIVIWGDTRSGTGIDLYAQRINGSGTAQWAADGVAVCTVTGDQYAPQIVSDGSGGAIVTWHDARSGNDDIYVQLVNGEGAAQWLAGGVPLCTATAGQYNAQIVSDSAGAGGAIVTWTDFRSGTNNDVYAQRVNGSGIAQWAADGVAVCVVTGDQNYQQIVSDGSGGAIVTWDDDRSGTNTGIYAQRVSSSGTPEWAAGGVTLCTASGDQYIQMLTIDGAGGAIVTWRDARSGTNLDIYAQRVNGSGTAQWAADGVAVCVGTSQQNFQRIVSDGSGGAIVTWGDERSGTGYDIYVQRVNGAGAVQWPADGVALCTAGNPFMEAGDLASDGSGGAIATWSDSRNGYSDIYASHVSSGGVLPVSLSGYSLE